jgi:competence protein ComEA
MRYLRACFICLLLTFAAAPATAEPLDINTADAEQLAATLKGVGPQKAAAIVRYRQQHGPFTSLDGLRNVTGIGERVIADNRGRIVTKPAAAKQ